MEERRRVGEAAGANGSHPAGPARRTPPVRGSYPTTGLSLPKGPVRGAALALIGLSFVVVALIAAEPWNWGSSNTIGVGYQANFGAPPVYGDGDGNTNAYGDATATATDNPDTTDNNPYLYAPTTDAPPTDDVSPTDTPGISDTSAITSTSSPDDVVTAYFNDINQQNYQAAWQLGGENLNETYTDYVNGFASTQSDNVTIESDDGDVVSADLTAVQDDGSEKNFTGQYTVVDGVITVFQVQQTS